MVQENATRDRIKKKFNPGNYAAETDLKLELETKPVFEPQKDLDQIESYQRCRSRPEKPAPTLPTYTRERLTGAICSPRTASVHRISRRISSSPPERLFRLLRPSTSSLSASGPNSSRFNGRRVENFRSKSGNEKKKKIEQMTPSAVIRRKHWESRRHPMHFPKPRNFSIS